jgi:hypothetical protein
MVPLDLARLRALLDTGSRLFGGSVERKDHTATDADLIIATVNALPALLSRVEDLEAGLIALARGVDIFGNVDPADGIDEVVWKREVQPVLDRARALLAPEGSKP